MFGTHGPEHDIDEVDAPIGHQAAGVIPEPAEVEMETVLIERMFGRGAEPEIIIHRRRRRGVGRVPHPAKPIQVNPTAHQTDFAELARLDKFDRFFKMLATAPLGAHLDNALMAERGFEHGAAFVNGFGQRFFDVNILAGLTGENGRQGMPMIGGGDENGVYVFSVKYFTEVAAGIRALAPGFFNDLGGFGAHGIVHIADDGAIHFFITEENAEDIAAPTAGADEAKADFVIGPKDGWSESQAGRGQD